MPTKLTQLPEFLALCTGHLQDLWDAGSSGGQRDSSTVVHSACDHPGSVVGRAASLRSQPEAPPPRHPREHHREHRGGHPVRQVRHPPDLVQGTVIWMVIKHSYAALEQHQESLAVSKVSKNPLYESYFFFLIQYLVKKTLSLINTPTRCKK